MRCNGAGRTIITVSIITIDVHGGSIEALLVTPPTADGPRPGVVVLHDVYGFTDDVRAISGKVADAGYVVITPNLYSRGGGPRCVVKVLRGLLSGGGQAVADVLATKAYLEGLDQCSGPVGVAGFCMGGQFALLTAPMGFAASAPFYGVPLPRKLETVLDGACPIVASFGSRDPLGVGAPAKLRRVLEDKEITHDLKAYPGVGHAFANRLPAQRVQRIIGFCYDEDAAADAWHRVFRFFDEHLTPSAPEN